MDIGDIKRVAVVGAGTMGAGTAELFAEKGFDVIWYNRSATGLERGLARIRANQQVLLDAGVLTPAQADAALARLQPTTDVCALADADLVSESVTEDLALKRDVWATLEPHCRPDAILTTDTSGLPVTDIAVAITVPTPAAFSMTTTTKRSSCCRSKRNHKVSAHDTQEHPCVT
jgi:3-hydroxyacyl-CoA dehydrogenase